MTQHTPSLICVTMLVLVFSVVPVFGQNDIEDPDFFGDVWYRLLVDRNGDYIEGEGGGLGWYYYPDSDMWRMWFYNGAYDSNRKGYLNYHVYTKAVNPTIPTYLVAYFGWTTPQWSELANGRPPMPGDMPTAVSEALYMSAFRIYTIDNVLVPSSIETERTHSISEYNPEWVCISIKCRNAYVYRGAYHECIAKDSYLGACCNRETGYCYTSAEADCPAPMQWLGSGTSCNQCTVAGLVLTDFGDAPDRNYRTLLASNGARHTIVPGVFLGRNVDGESDGQPTVTADGDDASSGDEDGVTFTSTLHAGQDASIEVIASTSGYLNAWIDFNNDGWFDEEEDRIFADQILPAGVNQLTFRVPTDAVAGWTFSRFRFNTRGLLDSYGPAEDGEVEDYCVQIVESQDSLAVSGAASLIWSQAPSPAADGTKVFEAGSVSSSLHLRELAADDWQAVSDQPITGIHWWGTFGGWTESYLPSDLPLAFHIGIWTDVPDPAPLSSATFAHPGALIWETYCTKWVWAVSGREASDNKSKTGRTCFLFSHLLSQDQWFQVDRQTKGGSGSRVYWLSIAALYDSAGGGPQHMWTWKLRATSSDAAGTSLETIVPPSDASSWPPTLGAQWGSGIPIHDAWFRPLDMAFQLTTFVPLDMDAQASAGPNAGAAVGSGELAMLAADWLNTVR